MLLLPFWLRAEVHAYLFSEIKPILSNTNFAPIVLLWTFFGQNLPVRPRRKLWKAQSNKSGKVPSLSPLEEATRIDGN
jgi:hypothetical protein